jgi:hypothetical protein
MARSAKKRQARPLPRRGTVEIETLRRYGRVPVGTRAVGWFVLSVDAGPYLNHCLEYRIQVGEDARLVGGSLYFSWDRGVDESDTWGMFHRGAWVQFHAADLFDATIQHLTHLIEDQSTSAGHQRFHVIRAEWQEEDGK